MRRQCGRWTAKNTKYRPYAVSEAGGQKSDRLALLRSLVAPRDRVRRMAQFGKGLCW